MNEHRNDVFAYSYYCDSLADIGKCRSSNEDEVIELPDESFFAVSDGMGGLADGGDTSKMIKEHLLPQMMKNALLDLKEDPTIEHAVSILTEKVRSLNDIVHELGNDYGEGRFGATLSGVWLVGECALFVNIGDSRGYLYERGELCRVTKDHNVAAHLVERGELTGEDARAHPSSSRLLRYIGMPPPAIPDIFIKKVRPGGAIMLCSDGMYGMLEDSEISEIISEGGCIVNKLVGAANENGGKDNISAVYITIV